MTGLEHFILRAGGIAVALAAIATLFAAVPPFKQLWRYLWQNLVTKPSGEWFRLEVTDAVAPIVDSAVATAVATAVPVAVDAAVRSTVEPAIEAVRRDLREHMDAEESANAESVVERREFRRALERASERLEGVEAKMGTRVLRGEVVLVDREDQRRGDRLPDGG